MATYNTKYILSYCNKDAIPLRVELQLKDYEGESLILVNERDYLQDNEGNYVTMLPVGGFDPLRDMNKVEGASNPFTLTYNNDKGQKNGTIYATSADMSFFEDMLFNIDDLATSDETAIRCIFYYNNSIEWIGYVMPDFFSVAIESNPIIDLTASDRLGVLKDIPYPFIDEFSLSKFSYLSIINQCLKQTSLELNLNLLCDFTCLEIAGQTVNDHFLSKIFVNEKRFIKNDVENISCYEVLMSILDQFNCLLTQYKGEWWIVNKEQLELGNGNIFKYSISNTFISKSVFAQNEINFSKIDTGGTRSIIPAGGKNTYNLDVNSFLPYPINGNIKKVTALFPGQPPIWHNWSRRTGISANTLLTKERPTSFGTNGSVTAVYQESEYALKVADSKTNAFSSEWLYQSDWFDVPTLDSLKTSFDIDIKAIGKPQTTMDVKVIIQFDNTYYKYAWLTYDDNGYYFDFQKFINDTGPYNVLDDNNINVNSLNIVFDNKYGNVTIPYNQGFKISVDMANGQNQNFDLTNAKIMVRVYPNKLNVPSGFLPSVTSYVESIGITFKNDNQDPKGTIYQSILDAEYTKPTEERKVLFGDYQDVGQNGYFYRYKKDSLSIQYNQNNGIVKNWTTINDSTSQPLLIHSLRQLTKSFSTSHEELKIGFDLNSINPFAKYSVMCDVDCEVIINDRTLQDTNGRNVMATIGRYLNNKKYIFVSGSIDYLRSSFRGVLAQVNNNEVESTEYIYSYFESNDIS